MSYLDRLRAKISPDASKPDPTKPTKPGYVSFVGASPAPSRQNSAANDDTEPSQDLPLLAALAEFDDLRARLGLRRNLAASPNALWAELPILRERVRGMSGQRCTG